MFAGLILVSVWTAVWVSNSFNPVLVGFCDVLKVLLLPAHLVLLKFVVKIAVAYDH